MELASAAGPTPPPRDAPPPSGEQYEIGWGDQRATIVQVGGGIREYRQGDRDVLDPYPVDAICDGAHGMPLVPWPNRLGDGRYHFEGRDYQVALTEPEKQNAIHGFLRWRPWALHHREGSRLTLAATIFPMPAFPFQILVQVEYRLGDEGLEVATTATNRGRWPCPYGAGQHPYLSPGQGLLDGCTLELDAKTRILTDPERQLPTGLEPVAGTDYDFRQAKRLGQLKVDYAFTDLARDDQGRAWARLTGNDGRRAEVWVDSSYPILELYTGDTLAPKRRRRGLGTEPMTCPPNALQTGEGVIRLDPGQSVTTRWGVTLS
ncbi:MAG: aldose 1-epimerase family protein [Candidatus Dormibacteria bacterium]